VGLLLYLAEMLARNPREAAFFNASFNITSQ
jgi:hypothetical protein